MSNKQAISRIMAEIHRIERLAFIGFQPLTPDDVQYWITQNQWTLEEAAALLNGFYPADPSDLLYEIKTLAIQQHIASLESSTKHVHRESLTDPLSPQEWIALVKESARIYQPIWLALTDKPLKSQSKPEFDVKAYAQERATDIALRMHAKTGKPPIKTAIYKELLGDPKIVGKRGEPYEKADSIRKTLLNDWKHPDYSNSD